MYGCGWFVVHAYIILTIIIILIIMRAIEIHRKKVEMGVGGNRKSRKRGGEK